MFARIFDNIKIGYESSNFWDYVLKQGMTKMSAVEILSSINISVTGGIFEFFMNFLII